MFTTKKIAIVSVINDLVTDNRVNRTCQTLVECGFEVLLIGRRLPGSMPVPMWPFKTIRMSMLFKSGPAFYFFFMLRLFFKLLFKKADLLYANDLDTLLPNYLVAKVKGIPLVYDSHELFCEVPELEHSPFKKKLWLGIESAIVPKLRFCITVNDSIAKIFSEKYKVPFHVVRNITDAPADFRPSPKAELKLPPDKKIILLQGAGINVDRGAEELMDAMRFVDDAILLVIGSGDSWQALKEKLRISGLGEKIRMIDKLPREELRHYTYNADLGISIDKNNNANYLNSLPNKIFDYLHAGVPILASRLPEIERIVETYNVGEFIESHDPQHIARAIVMLLNSPHYSQYKINTRKACEALNWQSEKEHLKAVLNHATDQQNM